MAETTPNNVGAQPPRDTEANKPTTQKSEPKKIVRLLTVVAYMMSVSMAAIMLSAYYIFLWNPKEHRPGPDSPQRLMDPHPCPECLLHVAGGVNAGQMNNMGPPPMYNESQMAETPRVLPAVEELTTTPLPLPDVPSNPQEYDDVDTSTNNYSIPLPVHS